jgi:hypothetical protein
VAESLRLLPKRCSRSHWLRRVAAEGQIPLLSAMCCWQIGPSLCGDE